MEILSIIAAASAAITIQASAPPTPNAEVSKACNEEIVAYVAWETPVIQVMQSMGKLAVAVYGTRKPEKIAIIKGLYLKTWPKLRPQFQSHLSALEIACHDQGIDDALAGIAGSVADLVSSADEAIAAMEKETP